MTDRLALFDEHRPTLVSAAYRILGSRADADDVVQEAWLRWADVDVGSIDNARAYLLTTTGRLALNLLRTRRRQRETYVGPWLPEPVASDDPQRDAEVADQVSMAMLVVLESLSPLERAAFVLTEVFGMNGPEVALALDRSPAAVRQLVSRARGHLRTRQPRHVVDAAQHKEVTERFLSATLSGDLASLVATLAPDVVLISDGGGLKQAARRPLHTADKVARWLLGVAAKPLPGELGVELRQVNGELAVVLTVDGEVDLVAFLTVSEGLISAVYAIRNPEKLRAV